jgi:hypothetical protein
LADPRSKEAFMSGRRSFPIRNFLIAAAIAAVGTYLLAAGCRRQEPTRWDEAQRATRGERAVSRDAVSGGSLNRFFPKGEGEWDIVFKQEKTGFAQASLQRGGKEAATLSISDTRNNPSAADKYRGSGRTIGGFPAAAVGSQGTGALVADRYQVQVRSTAPAFSQADREQWLQRFDLQGLSRLQ